MLHGGSAHAEPRGDRHILLTRQRSEDNPAAQRHLLRRSVRGFPLLQVCALTRLASPRLVLVSALDSRVR